MAAELCTAGLPAAPYHTQMDPLARQDVHSRWAAGALLMSRAGLSVHSQKTSIYTAHWQHLASAPQHSHACLVVSLQGTYRSWWRLLPLAWASTRWTCALWCTIRWQSECSMQACNPQLESIALLHFSKASTDTLLPDQVTRKLLPGVWAGWCESWAAKQRNGFAPVSTLASVRLHVCQL